MKNIIMMKLTIVTKTVKSEVNTYETKDRNEIVGGTMLEHSVMDENSINGDGPLYKLPESGEDIAPDRKAVDSTNVVIGESATLPSSIEDKAASFAMMSQNSTFAKNQISRIAISGGAQQVVVTKPAKHGNSTQYSIPLLDSSKITSSHAEGTQIGNSMMNNGIGSSFRGITGTNTTSVRQGDLFASSAQQPDQPPISQNIPVNVVGENEDSLVGYQIIPSVLNIGGDVARVLNDDVIPDLKAAINSIGAPK